MEQNPHTNPLMGTLYLAGSWMLTFFSFLSTIDVSTVAGMMSCAVSMLAIWYYILQIRKLKRDAE
ncbi:MAG: hypothetical protein EOP56_08295 [Sphingobacteriales bacterium]|nr:MAG: hypothetical protein EOP56_08295 [Sphingobacteriales bacterium]